MTERNVYQVAEWNGANGARWVAHQERLDAMLAIFGAAAIEAAKPAAGHHILDIGCGAGTTSIALADHVGPQGRVLGVDISAPLIDRARMLLPDGAPVDYVLADAASAVWPERKFDLLFSRFGVMFFDDPVAAFTHMRQALKPGGRLAFICWRSAGENDWVRLPMGAIRDLLPPAPPPDPAAPGPFSFGDGDRVRGILEQAGFADIMVAPFDHVIPFGRGDTAEAAVADAVAMAFEVGPLSRALDGQPADLRAQAAQAVAHAFAARPFDGAVMIDGAAWIVTARNS